MNIHVQVSVRAIFLIFLGINLEVSCWVDIVTLYLIFRGIPKLFFNMAAPFYTLISSV